MGEPPEHRSVNAQHANARRLMREFLFQQRAVQCAFLAQLVRTPSDNPPGDCAGHAAQAAMLLERLVFSVETAGSIPMSFPIASCFDSTGA